MSFLKLLTHIIIDSGIVKLGYTLGRFRHYYKYINFGLERGRYIRGAASLTCTKVPPHDGISGLMSVFRYLSRPWIHLLLFAIPLKWATQHCHGSISSRQSQGQPAKPSSCIGQRPHFKLQITLAAFSRADSSVSLFFIFSPSEYDQALK